MASVLQVGVAGMGVNEGKGVLLLVLGMVDIIIIMLIICVE